MGRSFVAIEYFYCDRILFYLVCFSYPQVTLTWIEGTGDFVICLEGFGTWTEHFGDVEITTVPFAYSGSFKVVYSPTQQPTSSPTPNPSAPSPEPTTTTTATVSVSFTLTSSNEPTAADKASLKNTLADETGVAEDDIKNFEVSATNSTVRRKLALARRGLLEAPNAAETAQASVGTLVASEAAVLTRRRLSTVTWTVSFDMVTDLSAGTYADSTAFATAIVDALTGNDFAAKLADNLAVKVVFDAASVAAVARSRNPSPSPTLRPSPRPTQQPSQAPSPLPSPRPSAEPTVRPSADPTAVPSRWPLPQPSASPTPLPTPRFVGTTSAATLAVGGALVGACLVSVAWAVRRVGRRSASTQLRKHHQRRQTLEQPPHFSAGESGSSRLAGRLAQLPRRPTALERELHAAQNAEQLTLHDSAFMASPIERDSVKPSTRLPVGSLNALDPAGLGKTFDYHALTGETQRELPFTGPPGDDDEEMKDSDSHSVRSHSTSLRSSRHSHASGGGVGSFFAAGVVPAGVLGGDSDSDWGSDGGDEERPPLNYAELLKHQARRNAHASSTAPAPTAAAAAVAWRESAARHPLTSSAVRSPARLPGRASVVAPRLLAEDRGAAATAGIEAEVGPMATLDEDGSAEAGSTTHALNVPVGLLSSASNAFAGLDSPLDAAVASSAAARRPPR